MDARTIDHIAAIESTVETTELIQRWKDNVEPGNYRLTGEKWKKYHEPKFLQNERKVIEERIQQIMRGREQGDFRQGIGPQHKRGFQHQTRRSEQRTVDPFWEVDRPTLAQQQQQNSTGPSATTNTDQQLAPVLMEEGEVDSGTDQEPSILEVPAWNWARYVGLKSVQYVKMVLAPKIVAQEENNWDLEQAVRETEKNFSTDLQLLMTQTTNDPTLLKILVCLERQQHELIPEDYQTHRKKVIKQVRSSLYRGQRIIVPKNLRATVISLLQKCHPAINKMTLAARHFWWPRMTEAIQKKCESCLPCKMSGKNIKLNIPSTETNSLPALNIPNEEIQLDLIGPITEHNRRFYILLSMNGIVNGQPRAFAHLRTARRQ